MFRYQIIPYTLRFQFEAGTSRGVLKEKKTWFLRLTHPDFPDRVGWGEAGPLPLLSPENCETFASQLETVSQWLAPKLQPVQAAWENLSAHWLQHWEGPWLPAAWFAWETAYLDWLNGGRQLVCDALFHAGQWAVPINGLVWMNGRPAMERAAEEKALAGYQAVKFKVGALDWPQELEMIRHFSQQHPLISIRLDANGAWQPHEALAKLTQLGPFGIHSVEQPIAPGQPHALAALCKASPIPIALDEELIGKPEDHQKFSLLECVSPAYLVLKPMLLGGLGQCHQWIKMAEDLGIQWWITSMLESNIGLNAVSQLAAQYRPVLPQGLGTGQLYTNNMASPLAIAGGSLVYRPGTPWDFECLGG